MNFVVQLLVGKLIEALCKYAEKKFTKIKSGHDKKAYVLNKIDEIFDIDEPEVAELKTEVTTFAAEKIDDVVAKVINKDR